MLILSITAGPRMESAEKKNPCLASGSGCIEQRNFWSFACKVAVGFACCRRYMYGEYVHVALEQHESWRPAALGAAKHPLRKVDCPGLCAFFGHTSPQPRWASCFVS